MDSTFGCFDCSQWRQVRGSIDGVELRLGDDVVSLDRRHLCDVQLRAPLELRVLTTKKARFSVTLDSRRLKFATKDERLAAQRFILNANRSKDDALRLCRAAFYGDLETVTALLEVADANDANYNGESVLLRAVRGGSLAIVKLLLERGADPYASNATTNESAMSLALKKQRHDLVDAMRSVTQLSYANGRIDLSKTIEKNPPWLARRSRCGRSQLGRVREIIEYKGYNILTEHQTRLRIAAHSRFEDAIDPHHVQAFTDRALHLKDVLNTTRPTTATKTIPKTPLPQRVVKAPRRQRPRSAPPTASSPAETTTIRRPRTARPAKKKTPPTSTGKKQRPKTALPRDRPTHYLPPTPSPLFCWKKT